MHTHTRTLACEVRHSTAHIWSTHILGIVAQLHSTIHGSTQYTHAHTHTHTQTHTGHQRSQAHTQAPPHRATDARIDPFQRQKCTYTAAQTRRSLHEGVCARMQKLTGPDTSEDAHGQVETAGDFISSCIFPLSPQVALPGRYWAGKAASGPCGHRKPEFTIDFCLSLGLRTDSSESEPAQSVGGPECRKPRAHRSEREQSLLKTRGC